ncbi:hypothetical protein RUND412_003131 [Rhizina undulata]
MERNSGGPASLTATEKEVLTELQKVLLTLNQINDSLLKTIALSGAKGALPQSQAETIATGKDVFRSALGAHLPETPFSPSSSAADYEGAALDT